MPTTAANDPGFESAGHELTMPGTEIDARLVLSGVADASAVAIEELKASVSNDALLKAARMIGAAESVAVVGVKQALPVAAFLAYELTQRKHRCLLLQGVGHAELEHVSDMNTEDLLIAIGFGDRCCPVSGVVSLALRRGVGVLEITDWSAGPVSRDADAVLMVRASGREGLQPWAPYVVLIQSLAIALGTR